MNRSKRNLVKAFFILIFIVLVISVWLWRGNPDALWEIVSQQCVPGQQLRGYPQPCKAVNVSEGYVVMKDRKGPIHDLLMPIEKLTGIEEFAGRGTSSNFFADAWAHALDPKNGIGNPSYNSTIALAVNSQHGRSQNQLHVHIACLKEEISSQLPQILKDIGSDWSPLPATILGHHYIALRLNDDWMTRQDPFQLLAKYTRANNDDLGKYSLALVKQSHGSYFLLSTRLQLSEFNLGSAGELLDYHCGVAKAG